ncbi:MAG TPA: hypothetical protein PJ991_09570 [Kiritimatiellia bacterium]|nr:hypothetical protein [Kiritimatiellia bacterium]
MRLSIGTILLILCGFAVQAQTRQDDWTDITRDQVDRVLLTQRGARLLDDSRFKWAHAQTQHFVIHYERKMFAVKVARQAEFFYEFIARDLGSAQDRMTNRSHIFIFRDSRDWNHFLSEYQIKTEWAFSLVEGMVMYLQQADSTRDSADVLGHEMTHLVFNRFYRGRMPTWLNEGTAEWYGEFAYSAFKGIKKSKRQVFRRIPQVYPVERLLTMSVYPTDLREVRAFYDTSKFLVGFLQLNFPDNKFEPFLAEMTTGVSVEDALKRHYGFNSIAEFEAAFRRFAR